LKGDLRELNEDGTAKEDGIVVEGAVMMPEYIKVEDQKKLFDGAKLGDVITFNPRNAYPDNDTEISSLLKIKKEEVAEHTGNFSYQITEISRFTKAEVNQELFDGVYGKDEVKDEKDFRKKIAEGMAEQFKTDSDYKFLLDLRNYMAEKIGKLQFPDELLKRVMVLNNKERGEEFVNAHYDESIKQLQWQLTRDQLAKANDIKVEEADVKATAKEQARVQFAQYGMQNVPEEYLENYANELLKKQENVNSLVDQTIDMKLVAAVKKVVKLNEKSVSLDDFNKLVEAK
jgi:trigger factor